MIGAPRLLALVTCLLVGCAVVPRLSERPEEYHLYRATRVAPTQEERLRAAHRYLTEMPRGQHARELRRWFTEAENSYYLEAFNRLPRLYAYVDALPRGPHIAEVEARIAALEARRSRKAEHLLREDERIAAAQARIVDADTSRRAFVGAFKDWTSRLVRIQSFGEPTSELDHETIFAFRLTKPYGSCGGDQCRKTLQPTYQVPGDRELVSRAAVLEIQLELEAGALARARLVGPELWTRLAEALALKSLPSASPEERVDAVQRSALLVRALLEPVLPAAECDVQAQPPVIVERRCRGLRARMTAADSPADDDVLEIAPSPAEPAAPSASVTPPVPNAAPAAR